MATFAEIAAEFESNQSKKSKPISFDEIASEYEAEKPNGTLKTYGQTVVEGLKGIPAYLASAVEGATPYDSNNLLDTIQADRKAAEQQFINGANANAPVLGGLATEGEVRQVAPSLSGSIAGMIPAVAGGLAAGPVGALVGAGVGLWGMKRSAENQLIKQNIDKANADRAAQNLPALNQQQSVDLQNQLNQTGDVSNYGYAEAVPETLGNLAEMALLKTPIGKAAEVGAILASPLKRALIGGGLKVAGSLATEQGEEQVTRLFQNPIQEKYGLGTQSAGDVAKQTFLATLPFAGLAGTQGAVQGYKGTLQRAADQLPPEVKADNSVQTTGQQAQQNFLANLNNPAPESAPVKGLTQEALPSEILARNKQQEFANRLQLTHDGVIKLPPNPDSMAENAAASFMEKAQTRDPRLRNIPGLSDIDPLANYRNLPENRQKVQLKADQTKALNLLAQHGSGFADQYAVDFGMNRENVAAAIEKLATHEPKTAINMLEHYVKNVVKSAPTQSEKYDPGIQGLANELQVNGDSAVVRDKNDVITGRTPSVNPDWFKNGAFSALSLDGQPMRRKASVKEIQAAVKKHYAGEKISGFEAGILRGLDNVIKQKQAESALTQTQNAQQEQPQAVPPESRVGTLSMPTTEPELANSANTANKENSATEQPAPVAEQPKPQTYKRIDLIESPAQGSLAAARESAKTQLARKKSIQAKIAENNKKAGNSASTAQLKLELIKIQDSINQAKQAETEALKQIEAEANRQGFTTQKDNTRYSLRQDSAEELPPESFITAPDGSIDFGEITPEIAKAIGRQSAKIRLRYGNEKQGLVHIEQGHKIDIEALGFNSIQEFIHEITQHFSAIYKNPYPNSRSLILIENKGKLKFASIQLEPSEDGEFYEIKNATPGREDQFKNKTPLWERTGPSTSSDKQTLLIPEAKADDRTIPQPKPSVQTTAPKNTHSPATLKAALSKTFGQGWFTRLLATDKFQIISREQAKAMGANENAQAFYSPENTAKGLKKDVTYFVADNIDQSKNLKKLMLHEIGVHALQLGRNSAQFKAIQQQLNNLMNRPNISPALKAAIAAAEKAGTSAELMNEEILGYLVEFHPDLSISQKIMAFFRNWLRNKGLLNGMTEQDVVYMASQALKAAPESLLFPSENRGASRKSQSAIKSIEANIKRGKEAMNKALLDKTSVHRAMFRNGMGWVDFVWGREGEAADSKGKRKGAMGLAHIMEARQRKDNLTQAQAEKMLFDLVETIAKGEEVQRFESGLSTTVKVDYDRYQVMLARKKGSNTWVVTGFEKDESDRGGSGYDAPPLTRSESTLTRNEAGADVKNIAQDGDTLQIFQNIDSRAPQATREQALKDVLNNPNHDRIMYIENNFVDILSQLEQQKGFEINC